MKSQSTDCGKRVAIVLLCLVPFAPRLGAQMVAPPAARTIDVAALEKALDAPAAPVPPDVIELAKKLGSDSWTEREGAQKKLTARGVSVLPPLKQIYQETKDVEVKERIVQVFRAALPQEELLAALQFGILGVNLEFQIENEQTAGVLINQVLPEKPGFAAGLQPGDVIIGFNDKELDPKEGLNGFRYRIMAAGKGTPVKLKVRRGAETKEFTVTLDGREQSSLNMDELKAFESWYWQQWFDLHVKTRK